MTAQTATLGIRLFGAFEIVSASGLELELSNVKAKALMALLAASPNGMRTRSWLQDALWSLSDPEHGRASLRQCLAYLRRIFGDDFDTHFIVNNDVIRLRMETISFLGSRDDGEFLEGMDIADEGFSDWLRKQRASPPAHVEGDGGQVGSGDRSERPLFLTSADVSGTARLAPRILVLPFVAFGAARFRNEIVLKPDPFSRLTEGGPDFVNLLGDAIAQDVTRALSHSRLLDVISHLSARNIRFDLIGLKEIQSAFDVDYVIDGSIRFANDAYRLTVDFIDVADGKQRWSQEFGGGASSFFAGRESIVPDIAEQISRTIIDSSIEPLNVRALPDIESHRLLLSGVALMYRTSLESFSHAKACLLELVERVPKNASLHAWLAKWYVLNVQQGWSEDVAADADRARIEVAKALEINPNSSFALAMDGLVHNNLLKRFDIAFERFDEALEVNRSSALAWLLKGTLHAFVGEGEKAVRLTDRARALSPLDPYKFYFDSLSATARLANRDYEGALRFADSSRRLNQRHTSTLRVRTIALECLGRHEDARLAAQDLVEHDPGFTIDQYRRTHPAAEQPIGREWVSAMVAAGVP